MKGAREAVLENRLVKQKVERSLLQPPPKRKSRCPRGMVSIIKL